MRLVNSSMLFAQRIRQTLSFFYANTLLQIKTVTIFRDNQLYYNKPLLQRKMLQLRTHKFKLNIFLAVTVLKSYLPCFFFKFNYKVNVHP